MRFAFSWMLIAFLFVSCGIFKSTPDRPKKSEPPVEERKEKEQEKEEEEVEKEEVIESEVDSFDMLKDTLTKVQKDQTEFDLKEQYRIQLMLPLTPEKPNEEGEKEDRSLSNWNSSFMEYLAGFKFGMNEFIDSTPDFSYRLSVESSEDMDRLIKQADSLQIENADVLIGGVEGESLEKMSNWAARTGGIYVSPWVPSRPLASNTRFIQLMPNLQTHCNVISRHLMENYRLENIYIVLSEQNKDRIKCFNKYFEEQGVSSSFQSLVLSHDMLSGDKFKSEQLEQAFNQSDTNILVIPEDRNKGFIHSLISKLTALKDYDFKIFGLQGWTNYDLLHDYFEKMPFYLSVDQHIEQDSTRYQIFEKAYYDEFGDLPSTWAVKGYDQAWLIAYGLSKYGMDLPQNLQQIYFRGLGTEFQFTPLELEQTEEDSLYHNVNRAVQLLEYKHHRFQKIRE